MNMIFRLLTVSFMISMLAAGIAGFAGTRAAGAPISLAIEELRENCAFVLQGAGALANNPQQPDMPAFYYGVIEFPNPAACPPETLRLF